MQDTEIAKLTARLHKAEMQTTSLEREVERKQKENQVSRGIKKSSEE